RPAGDARPGRRVPTHILPARRGWAHDSGESVFLVLLPGVLRKAPHLRLAGGPPSRRGCPVWSSVPVGLHYTTCSGPRAPARPGGAVAYPVDSCHDRGMRMQGGNPGKNAPSAGVAGLEQHILDLLEEAGHRLRSEEHTSELQSRENLVCRLLLEKK